MRKTSAEIAEARNMSNTHNLGTELSCREQNRAYITHCYPVLRIPAAMPAIVTIKARSTWLLTISAA
ncbi:hypothetical protein TOL_0932 [Thalassolituus oleivorans MIL-1]|uniref:Uncharacterized protein n=1 Tax=Thalassolituus oleivorans MIL-1 TaxID=1298593 RepID=M5DPF5_9GAMM|nr:hypothetical protein TOL_0932 [Thalassolituus oleivorans MIL-1]